MMLTKKFFVLYENSLREDVSPGTILKEMESLDLFDAEDIDAIYEGYLEGKGLLEVSSIPSGSLWGMGGGDKKPSSGSSSTTSKGRSSIPSGSLWGMGGQKKSEPEKQTSGKNPRSSLPGAAFGGGAKEFAEYIVKLPQVQAATAQVKSGKMKRGDFMKVLWAVGKKAAQARGIPFNLLGKYIWSLTSVLLSSEK